MTIKPLELEQIAKLHDVKLPNNKWRLVRADVEFVRDGVLGEWAQVIFDSLNNTFYVKTNKCIVYPEDRQPLDEAMDLMDKINKIIK